MPNELLPTNIGFGTVVGRFGSAPLIAGDADGFPDFSPATGLTVTFTPSTAAVIDATASPAPVTIEMVPIVCGLDTQGYLVGGDGQRGVKLIATNDTDINPSGWTYSVTFLRGGAKVAAFRDFSMSLPAGVTKDIALTIPVPSSEGVSLSQAQAAEAAAVSAASAAAASAAAAAASTALFSVDNLPQAGTTGKALAKASTETAAQTAIGATTVGKAIVTATDTTAAQTAIGATAVGKALVTATDTTAAQTAVGATVVGKALVTAVDADAGRSALSAGPAPIVGTGVPEGAVTGIPGAAYTRTDGGERSNVVPNPIGDNVQSTHLWFATRAALSIGPGYMRATITDATATDYGQRVTPTNTNVQAVAPSTAYSIRAKVRSNTGCTMSMKVSFYTAGNVGIGASTTASANVTPNDTTFIDLPTMNVTSPATAAFAYLQIGISGTGGRSVGQWFDVKSVFIGTPGGYFDGDTGSSGGGITRWGGMPNRSVSYAGAAPVNIKATGTGNTGWAPVASDAAIAAAVARKVERGELCFNVKDYGARGDGFTDDTTSIQACVAATRVSTAAGVSGGPIYFPPGEYVISDTILFYRFTGHVWGAGMGTTIPYGTRGSSTAIRWTGPDTKPMFRVQDSMYVRFSNFRMEGNDTSKPTYGIEFYNLSADQQGSNSACVVDGLRIGRWPWSSQGGNVGLMQCGIGWTGDDGNNDEFHVTNCIISGCDKGFDIKNIQSIWGCIDNTTISGSTTVGIESKACFSALNIRFDTCAVDVKLTAAAQANIVGMYSENSGLVGWCTGATSRLSVWGGLWTLNKTTLGTGPFLQHDAAINQGGFTLGGGLYIYDNGIGAMPKIKTVSPNTAHSWGPGRLTILDAMISRMVIGDFDVTTAGVGDIEINIISGGINVQGLRLSGGQSLSTAPSQLAGTGSPEGVVTATIGSTFQRIDGSTTTSFYVKTSGTGNTGWTAK